MNVLIVYCHPSKRSYTYEILGKVVASLEKEGISYEISDLYAMNFQTDMSEEEYNREGFANLELPIPEDVKAEHQKIEAADCVIFLYPVWWSDCPAKLKGWFDRVLSVGYAYGYEEAAPNIHRMKTIPYGLVLCTAGYTNEELKTIGISESMRNVMLHDRLGKRFKTTEMIILGGTLAEEKARKTHSKILEEIGKKIATNCG